jgi:hypothetical protein
MAAVDPVDETIERYLVQHYRADPVKGQWEHAVVAAYDNQDERCDAFTRAYEGLEGRGRVGIPLTRRSTSRALPSSETTPNAKQT